MDFHQGVKFDIFFKHIHPMKLSDQSEMAEPG